MLAFVSALLTGCAALLAIPTAVLVCEVVVGVISSRRKPVPLQHDWQGSIAVLVPAHNESGGVRPTIESIRGQLRPQDRLIVIADNCSDDTAEVAAGTGAEVIVRNDVSNIGKGFALEFGINFLASAPPDAVIIVDADCLLEDDTIHQLTAACTLTGRPAQALNLMTAPEGSTINYQVAEFAWRVKNWARPLGLAALGFPCQLMGTGMAFPWSVIHSAQVGTAAIVEDLKLGLDLASLGTPPLFCPSAKVVSAFPANRSGADDQRRRWESGHLNLIFRLLPRMMFHAVKTCNLSLLVLTLDLLVPPLSLFVFLLCSMCVGTGIATLFGISPSALTTSAATLLGLSVAIAAAWYGFGRDILPHQALPKMFSYLIAKFPIYRHILGGRSPTHWVRADRARTKLNSDDN